MSKNLVIVESPAKAKTIEGYLGKDFTVKSSSKTSSPTSAENMASNMAGVGFVKVSLLNSMFMGLFF